MSSYRQILYHIVFRTKDSQKTLNLENSEELYKYIWGIIKGKNGVLYRINGMEDHIHILSDLHPSSIWLKESGKFPQFNGWADGYAAFTYSYSDKETVINYIKNQREHHKTITFEEELRKLLTEHGVEINENFFF